MKKILKNNKKVLKCFEYIKGNANSFNVAYYLSELTEMVKIFFEYEEKLLTKEGYPDMMINKLHEDYLIDLSKIRSNIESDYFVFDLDLFENLKKCFINHVKNEDSKYMSYLRIKKFCETQERKLN